ncbi:MULTISPECIES: hypothetical protein [unclassified Streptomyces]|uniref:hypothetical protein n=1 Tax=unclassified Streptomyces TaxID=2593676 RepID=UPI003393F67E
MPQMPKVELYAAIRRDHRSGMSMRELERKHGVTWRTVRKALDSSWPEPRKKLPPRATTLDPYKPVNRPVQQAGSPQSTTLGGTRPAGSMASGTAPGP